MSDGHCRVSAKPRQSTRNTPIVTRTREILRMDIRLRSLFSLAFGTIIGVGWITVLGSWLSEAGSLGAMLAFGGGGMIMMVIGL